MTKLDTRQTALIIGTTRAELEAKWKQMYQQRKKFGPDGALPSAGAYGYFSGWLLLKGQEVTL